MKQTTEQAYRERMARVLEHIQQHLDESLALDDLAAVSHFSSYHFHRIFTGLVGETVHKYVRRLRLERAATQLKLTERSVLEIAFDAGYETHESFTRAFKTRFRCAPSEFRALDRRDKEAAASDSGGGGGAGLEVEAMEVQIRPVDPVHVIFLRHVGPYHEVGRAYGALMMWASGRGLLSPATQVIGLSYDDPGVTEPDKLRCDACLSMPEGTQGAGEIGAKTVGGMPCAVTTHRGPYDRLGETYDRMLGHWFPRSGHEPAPNPSMEFYRNDPRFTPGDELITDVCVPLLD